MVVRNKNIVGCSNHGCVFGGPKGMGTNGGCHCLDNLDNRFQKAKVRNNIRILVSQYEEQDLSELLYNALKGYQAATDEEKDFIKFKLGIRKVKLKVNCDNPGGFRSDTKYITTTFTFIE